MEEVAAVLLPVVIFLPVFMAATRIIEAAIVKRGEPALLPQYAERLARLEQTVEHLCKAVEDASRTMESMAQTVDQLSQAVQRTAEEQHVLSGLLPGRSESGSPRS